MSYTTAFILAAVVVLAVLAELLVLPLGPAEGGELPPYYFRGLFALLGVVAAALVVVVARLLARYWLERDESYYD